MAQPRNRWTRASRSFDKGGSRGAWFAWKALLSRKSATVIRWVAANGAALDLDTDKLIFSGDSSGATFAAVLAIMARDGELPKPRAQVLLYPPVDGTCAFPSYSFDMPGLILSGQSMRFFWKAYLQDQNPHDWRASPWFAEDLSGVAPCVFLSTGADPVEDECLAYVRRLQDVNVSVFHLHFAGQPHGFTAGKPLTERVQSTFATLGAMMRGCLVD